MPNPRAVPKTGKQVAAAPETKTSSPAKAKAEVVKGDFEGYCIKCKGKKPIQNAEKAKWSNGTKIVRGSCPTCSGKLQVVVPVAVWDAL